MKRLGRACNTTTAAVNCSEVLNTFWEVWVCDYAKAEKSGDDENCCPRKEEEEGL